MALELTRQGFEVEELIGTRVSQVLLRAEALVPGAGREAIEPLLADASLFIDAADLQADRVVLDGAAACQAVYRQGEEPAPRALTAQAKLSQVVEIPGAEPGMFSRAQGTAEHVEARYENGHMIFLVTCTLRVQVLRLRQVEGIADVRGAEGLETAYEQLESVKLAAESSAMALLRETTPLPAALDARATLMDWTSVELETAERDLGGIRVKGRVVVQTLVSSGEAARPASTVRVPLPLDQLVELPEWLAAGDIAIEADVRSVRTQIVAGGADGSPQLTCEAELRVRALANVTDRPRVLRDIYATRGRALEVEYQQLDLCTSVSRGRLTDTVRGSVALQEGAPRVGSVLAVQAKPVIGEWRGMDGAGRIEGVLEVAVLYMPAGGEPPAAAQAELPFAVDVPVPLDGDSEVAVQAVSAEAAALVGDRLDVKAQVGIHCETRIRRQARIVSEVSEGAEIQRQPGIVIVWPAPGEDAWALGRRYAIPAAEAAEAAPGSPLVLKV